MSYRDFIKDLKNENLSPVYLFYGTEKYLVDYLIDEIKKKYIEEVYESLNYIYIDDEKAEFSKIENANETLPFMAEKKLVVVNNWQLLIKKKGTDDTEEESFIEYLKRSNPSSILIFIVNGEKIDKRRKVIKSITKYGKIIEVNRLSDVEMTSWINKKFKEHKKNIKGSDIHKIIEYTGYFDKESDTDIISVENEIIKLVDFVGDRDSVSSEDIDKVVTRSIQSNIFVLVDSIAQKDMKKSIDSLRNLIGSQVAVQMILHMIGRQLRMILNAKLYLDKGYSQRMIKDKMGIRYDFIINKLISQSRNFTLDEIKKAIILASKLDIDLKHSRIDEELGIEKLIVEIINS